MDHGKFVLIFVTPYPACAPGDQHRCHRRGRGQAERRRQALPEAIQIVDIFYIFYIIYTKGHLFEVAKAINRIGELFNRKSGSDRTRAASTK